MAERKQLTSSQRELLSLRRGQVNDRIAEVRSTQVALQASIRNIMLELGVPEGEVPQWRTDPADDYISKVEPTEKVKEVIPGKERPSPVKPVVKPPVKSND